MLQGFKLASIVALDLYLEAISAAPDLLDIDVALGYHDYYHFTRGRGRRVTKALGQSSPTMSGIVAKVNSLASGLVKCNNWQEVDYFKPSISKFSRALRDVFRYAYVVVREPGITLTLEKAIKDEILYAIWGGYTDSRTIAGTYSDYYIDWSDDKLPGYDEIFHELRKSNVLTRFDAINLLPSSYRYGIPPESWSIGYAVMIYETLKVIIAQKKQPILESFANKIVSINNWRSFDYCWIDLAKSLSILPLPFSKFNYQKIRKTRSEDLRHLIVSNLEGPSPEPILSAMGNRARIVDEGYSSPAFLSFTCVLNGAIQRARKSGEPVRVLIAIHREENNREDYSLAIFMPAYGMCGLSNASRWWVFYKIGNNHSGNGVKDRDRVFSKLRRSSKNMDISVMIAKEGEFFKYCEDPGYVRLEAEIDATKRMITEIRSTYPELLIAAMLSQMNYQNIRLRLKPKALTRYREMHGGKLDIKGDLDVVGVLRDREIIVFESRGQAARVHEELEREIKLLSNTIDFLRNNLESLCEDLDIEYNSSLVVKGIFASMADLGGRRKYSVRGNVELWDFVEFVRQLNENKVSKDYSKLLKSVMIGTLIRPP